MILQKLDNDSLDNFPVVIFGSGPSGITTALELEKKNIKCLLVEAGGEDFSETSQEFYKGEIIGDHLSGLSISRLRQLGGTSGHWGGMSKPMEEYNFEHWPLKYEDLKPYSKKTCEILNINHQFRKGSLSEFFNQIEYQYSKVRFADKYKDHIKNSNKILLVLNTQLSHFIGQNNNTDHAVCISDKSTKKIRAKYFILACGGIENSRILLWTRNKNQQFIDNNLPIGKYWMNHPFIHGGRAIISRKKIKEKMKSNFLGFSDIMNFATTEKFIKNKKTLSSSIYMFTDQAFREDTVIHDKIMKDILCVAPKYGKKLANILFIKDFWCENIFMQLEEEPNENSKIVLGNEKDDLEIPRVKLFYKKSYHSLTSAKLFLEEFANLCRIEDLGRIAIIDNIYNLEGFELLGDGHHLGGTKMGIDKFDSVVDKNLKVHNINNLYIGGSSSFVTSGYTNPTFTIIQLAIRLAEKINEILHA